MKVKNTGQALMGVHFSGDLVWIKPGEEHEGDMTEAEVKLIENEDRLTVSGSTSGGGKPDYERDDLKNVDIDKPATSKDTLLVIAAYEQADVPQGDAATKADLIAAIKAKRKSA